MALVYPVAAYAPTTDSRASTMRLLLAQTDRWIETRLEPSDEIIHIQVSATGSSDRPCTTVSVLIWADVFDRILPSALAQGAVQTTRLSMDQQHAVCELHWPALGVTATAYFAVGRKLPGQRGRVA
jgi:hypothetical protein